ncbi:DUF2142 domain-containing protein [Cellulomonas humilata]|uniref:DUF2142 domain-containing protein n=1 Tax=Cellulomonas humilata TaxID=144055 RepID=A0A7Y6DXC9_9CELL|nr:DUF2142 domain-containing protein [Cellulomonas humilata]NUU16809.1 DUF2142 domain-containing protein [Cellulomonas humilata]
MTARADAPTPTTAPPRGPVLRWLAVGALLFGLGALWSLAVPLMASPDEPSHVVRAAAVARGQLSGTANDAPQSTQRPGVGTLVRLPSDFAAALALPNCFAFDRDQPADCQEDLPAAGPEVLVETFAGQYPPLYYALVGWPSLFLSAGPSIVAMRLVSAAISAALLTWAAFRLTTTAGNRAGLWGLGVAITPMCLFLAGTVNPAGLEISAAVAFWAACLVLVSRDGPVSTAALVQAVVSGALLLNIRATGPVWALAIVVVALVAAPRGRWRELLRLPSARWVGVGAAVAVLASVGWLATHGSVVTTRGLYPQFADLRTAVLGILGDGFLYLQNMIGDFGWLDAPAPPLTFVGWYLALGALLLPAMAAARTGRPRAALGLLVAGVAAAPLILQLPTVVDTGLIWQGRYALPIAVGIPLLAALVLRVDGTESGEAHRRTARAVVPVLLVAHVAAFWWGSRRYAEGLDGQLITGTPDWSSPIGYLSGIAIYAVVASALAWALWSFYRPAPVESVEPTASAHAEA